MTARQRSLNFRHFRSLETLGTFEKAYSKPSILLTRGMLNEETVYYGYQGR